MRFFLTLSWLRYRNHHGLDFISTMGKEGKVARARRLQGSFLSVSQSGKLELLDRSLLHQTTRYRMFSRSSRKRAQRKIIRPTPFQLAFEISRRQLALVLSTAIFATTRPSLPQSISTFRSSNRASSGPTERRRESATSSSDDASWFLASPFFSLSCLLSVSLLLLLVEVD